MGMSPIGASGCFSESSCSKEDHCMVPAAPLPNPNPKKFEILRIEEVKEFAVVEVKYPDCTNYEGRKIMIYKADSNTIMNQTSIDPHFCDGNHLSPIARFEPTKYGWEAAKLFASKITDLLNSVK